MTAYTAHGNYPAHNSHNTSGSLHTSNGHYTSDSRVTQHSHIRIASIPARLAARIIDWTVVASVVVGIGLLLFMWLKSVLSNRGWYDEFASVFGWVREFLTIGDTQLANIVDTQLSDTVSSGTISLDSQTLSADSENALLGIAQNVGDKINLVSSIAKVVGIVSVVFSVLSAAVSVLGVFYEVILTAFKGQTIGKMVVGIKVVSKDELEKQQPTEPSGLIKQQTPALQPPGLLKSIVRYAVLFAPFLLPVFGWLLAMLIRLSILWDSERQGWHDKVVSTVVVKSRG